MIQNSIKKYFPNSEELDAKIKSFYPSLDIGLIISVVQRQAYSEQERYHVKKKVDIALLSSPFVEEEGNKIKAICINKNLSYVDNYLALLKDNFNDLISICFDFLDNYEIYKNNHKQFKKFLIKYLKIADVDNAHAMYLSSDNWDFSIFNNVIEQLSVKYTTKEFENILQGDILDIRTVAHISKEKYKFDKNEFIAINETLKKHNCIEENHIMPILLFQYGKTKLNKIPIKKNILLESTLITKYKELYFARFLYDSIEYFGFYAFVRNLIAELCSNNIDKNIANNITLYQFYDAYHKLKEKSFA